MAESFMCTLKREEVNSQAYRDRAEAAASIGAFIDEVYKNRLEAFFRQLLARPGNRADAGFEGLGNLAVTPSVASFRDVSFQQNACLGQLPGRMFALCISALRRSRSSSLSVTTYFFTAIHSAVTMLLRHCGAIDSENRRGINDEGD